jgi:hypothetical protein
MIPNSYEIEFSIAEWKDKATLIDFSEKVKKKHYRCGICLHQLFLDKTLLPNPNRAYSTAGA